MTTEDRLIALEKKSQIIEDQLEEATKQLRETKHKLADATTQLDKVYTIYQDTDNTLKKVLLALNGDQMTKQPGIIDRLIAVEQFRMWFNNKKAIATGYALGVSAVIGAASLIVFGVKWIASHLLK